MAQPRMGGLLPLLLALTTALAVHDGEDLLVSHLQSSDPDAEVLPLQGEREGTAAKAEEGSKEAAEAGAAAASAGPDELEQQGTNSTQDATERQAEADKPMPAKKKRHENTISAEAKLAQAKDALTQVSLQLTKLDTELEAISAAHQASDDKLAFSGRWREAKKRQAKLKAEFEDKDQAMQDAFYELQKYREEELEAKAREKVLQDKEALLAKAKRESEESRDQLEADDDALKAAKIKAEQSEQRTHRMEDQAVSDLRK